MRIERHRSCLLIVDIQEKLLPVMRKPGRVEANAAKLVTAAQWLEVPILASEQYPKGLGRSVACIRDSLQPDEIVEKLHFSILGEEGMRGRLEGLERDQVVLAGIEAHVCVLQTALDLLTLGFHVFVVRDATDSRQAGSHQAALERLHLDGARTPTTEMVLFEWLEKAGTPMFKELMPLIK